MIKVFSVLDDLDMASFVVDWSTPVACTSALKLTKKLLVLDGENPPLVNTDLDELYKKAKVGMKVLLREKILSEVWAGIIESKWGKY